jgi:hypothetical protein
MIIAPNTWLLQEFQQKTNQISIPTSLPLRFDNFGLRLQYDPLTLNIDVNGRLQVIAAVPVVGANIVFTNGAETASIDLSADGWLTMLSTRQGLRFIFHILQSIGANNTFLLKPRNVGEMTFKIADSTETNDLKIIIDDNICNLLHTPGIALGSQFNINCVDSMVSITSNTRMNIITPETRLTGNLVFNNGVLLASTIINTASSLEFYRQGGASFAALTGSYWVMRNAIAGTNPGMLLSRDDTYNSDWYTSNNEIFYEVYRSGAGLEMSMYFVNYNGNIYIHTYDNLPGDISSINMAGVINYASVPFAGTTLRIQSDILNRPQIARILAGNLQTQTITFYNDHIANELEFDAAVGLNHNMITQTYTDGIAQRVLTFNVDETRTDIISQRNDIGVTHPLNIINLNGDIVLDSVTDNIINISQTIMRDNLYLDDANLIMRDDLTNQKAILQIGASDELYIDNSVHLNRIEMDEHVIKLINTTAPSVAMNVEFKSIYLTAARSSTTTMLNSHDIHAIITSNSTNTNMPFLIANNSGNGNLVLTNDLCNVTISGNECIISRNNLISNLSTFKIRSNSITPGFVEISTKTDFTDGGIIEYDYSLVDIPLNQDLILKNTHKSIKILGNATFQNQANLDNSMLYVSGDVTCTHRLKTNNLTINSTQNVNNIDNDETLTANSSNALVTQNAIKSYVDNRIQILNTGLSFATTTFTMTISTSTSINISAGAGFIIFGGIVTSFSWSAMTGIAISNILTEYKTYIYMTLSGSTPTILQTHQKPFAFYLKNKILLGIVYHPLNIITAISIEPILCNVGEATLLQMSLTNYMQNHMYKLLLNPGTLTFRLSQMLIEKLGINYSITSIIPNSYDQTAIDPITFQYFYRNTLGSTDDYVIGALTSVFDPGNYDLNSVLTAVSPVSNFTNQALYIRYVNRTPEFYMRYGTQMYSNIDTASANAYPHTFQDSVNGLRTQLDNANYCLAIFSIRGNCTCLLDDLNNNLLRIKYSTINTL